MNINIVNGNEIMLQNIKQLVIYGHGEKLFTTDRDYFEEYHINGNGKIDSVYDGRIDNITLASEPKKARKENLTRTDNYLLKYTSNYSWDNGYTLYIHESEISVNPAGEFVYLDSHGETDYRNAVNLHFVHGVTFTRCKIEKVCDYNGNEKFTLPNGCKWSNGYSRDPEHPNYDVVHRSRFSKTESDYIVKRWLEPETAHDVFTACNGISRREKTQERLQREHIADFCNEHKVFHREISHYEIENMMQYFDIKLREE